MASEQRPRRGAAGAEAWLRRGAAIFGLIGQAIGSAGAQPISPREIWQCEGRGPAHETRRLELDHSTGTVRMIVAHRVLEGRFKLGPGHLVAVFGEAAGAREEITIGLASGRMIAVDRLPDGSSERRFAGRCQLVGNEI